MLVERKVCFILDVGNQAETGASEGGELGSMADSPTTTSCPNREWERAFTCEGRGLHADVVQLALTVILKLVLQWSAQRHPDYFKCHESAVPEPVCCHFLEFLEPRWLLSGPQSSRHAVNCSLLGASVSSI